MKIIRVVTFLDFGGLEQRMINLSHVKDKNVWIFCAIGKGGKASREIEANGKRVLILNQDYKIPSLKAIRKLVRIFQTEKPDVVHTSGSEANFHGIIAARLVGIKTIIGEEIGIPAQSKLARQIFHQLFKFSKSVVVNSTLVSEYLITEKLTTKDKIKIIANPLLIKDKRMIPLSAADEFELLTVSRLKSVKNIEAIIRFLPDLIKIKPNIKFHIVGDGDQKEALELLVKTLSLSNVVIFHGFQHKPFEVIGAADLFVLNSHTEGFSNALAEAMGYGVPCLSTRVGAASEMIIDGYSGWLVNPGEDQGLLEKLKKIVNQPKSELEKIGTSGRDSIQGRFSLENHRAELLKIYDGGSVTL